MPCQYYTDDELKQRTLAANRELREELDSKTRRLDELSEALMAAMEGKEVPLHVLEQVVVEQVAHRKEDLVRLEKTLTDMLNRVQSADPSKPLKDQLGFDPDSI